MYKHKVVLHFPKQIVDQPVICQLARKFDMNFSVLRAQIETDTAGMMVLGLDGDEAEVRRALDYLTKIGVRIEPLELDIWIREDRCTHCGACVGQCPTDALIVDAKTRKVSFDSEKCIACQNCVPACPFEAIHVSFARVDTPQ